MSDGERASNVGLWPAELTDMVRDAEGLLVGFDFDGTLAPIADDPDVPTLSPDLRRSLGQLAERGNVRLAIVSGRELADLRERVGLEGVVYAGNHGLELRRDGEYSVRPAVEQYRSVVQSLADSLQADLAEVPGTRLENKDLTLTVHVRQTPPERVEDVRPILDERTAEYEDVTVRTGKAVFEVTPSVPHDKGTVLSTLEAETPSDWLTLYLGDDTTDEDAFKAIQPEGIGVHVGTDPNTAAVYSVESQRAVPEFLTWLASTTAASG